MAVWLSSSLIYLCLVGNVFEHQPYEGGCWEKGFTTKWCRDYRTVTWTVGCRTEQNPNRQSRLVVLESLGIRERTSLWIQPSIKADWFVTVQVLSSHTMKQTLSVNNFKTFALDQVLKTKWFNTTTTKLLCLRQDESFATKIASYFKLKLLLRTCLQWSSALRQDELSQRPSLKTNCRASLLEQTAA